jgi:hypothetical protein
MLYVSKIYQKNKTLSTHVAFSYDHFVAADYAYNAINDFIFEHNIQYAYVFGISIKNIQYSTHTIGSRVLNNLKENIANDVYVFFSNFPKKIFFTNEENYLFVLVGADINATKNLKLSYQNNYNVTRQKTDPLNVFQNLKISPFSYNGIQIKSDVNLITGIYGVHSNDILGLTQNLQATIESLEIQNNCNVIQLFDPHIQSSLNYDIDQFHQLKQIININTITIKPIYHKYGNDKIVFPIFSSMKATAFNTSTIVKLVPNHLKPILLRHLMARAVK